MRQGVGALLHAQQAKFARFVRPARLRVVARACAHVAARKKHDSNWDPRFHRSTDQTTVSHFVVRMGVENHERRRDRVNSDFKSGGGKVVSLGRLQTKDEFKSARLHLGMKFPCLDVEFLDGAALYAQPRNESSPRHACSFVICNVCFERHILPIHPIGILDSSLDSHRVPRPVHRARMVQLDHR